MSEEKNEVRKRDEAVEKLRRLINTNFEDDILRMKLNYKSKTEASLLTVNK